MHFSYANSIDYIYSLNKKRHIQLKFGFERMEAALAKFGHPQRELKFVHIAGTKGKGSTISFLSFIFREKYRIGLFTSPSLMNTSERISLNGALITPKEFTGITIYLKKLYKTLPKELIPTTFESFTIMAFIYFNSKEVDLSLLEVGMGGRLDATNIIEKPLVSIITPISFDHQKSLGDTLRAIAGEKAGIIKERVPVVVGKQMNEAKERILEGVQLKHADYFLYGKDFYVKNFSENSSGTTFDFLSPYFGVNFEGIHIPLIGLHQAENASVSIQAALLLDSMGFKISDQDIVAGIERSFWPGRFEIVDKHPLVVLDGAHNGASAKALYNTLVHFKKRKMVFLFSILKDKNIDDVLSKIAFEGAVFVITEVPFSGVRRMPVGLIKENMEKYVPQNNIIVERDFRKAFQIAYGLLEENDLLCVTGSLYLVASVRKIMNRFVFSGNIL